MPIDTRISSFVRAIFVGGRSVALGELLKLLLLEGSGLGELDGDLVSRQLGVSVGHSLDLLLNEHLVQRVKEDLLSDAGGLAHAGAAADDAGGDNDVVEGGGVHGLKGTAAGALLAGVRDLSLGVNGSVDDDDDGVLELLLEVVNDRAGDLLEELEGAEGNLDKDVLLLGAISGLVGLLGHRVDEDGAELTLDLLVGGLESGERLGGFLLELGSLDLFAGRKSLEKFKIAADVQ